MLAMEIKRFIDTFIKSEELQKYSDYEDSNSAQPASPF